MRTFGHKKDEVTGDRRKLHKGSFIICTHHQLLLGKYSQGIEVGWTCGTHGRGEKCVQNFCWKARRKKPP
jgi:hypothetical protein